MLSQSRPRISGPRLRPVNFFQIKTEMRQINFETGGSRPKPKKKLKLKRRPNKFLRNYDKRLNVLIHGFQEDPDNAWENRETTTEKFQTFLKNDLKITNPAKIKFSNFHRLPQLPIKKTEHRCKDQYLLSCKHCLIKI